MSFGFAPSQPANDTYIQKAYPGIVLLGTELPLGAWDEVREVAGALWMTSNATYVAALGGFQQVNVAQPSAALVLAAANLTHYYVAAGAALPIAWGAGNVLSAAVGSYIVFNVKTYGATGNGVTDDTAAINAAITALAASGGGTLYFPTGIYLISSTLGFGNGFLGSYSTYTINVVGDGGTVSPNGGLSIATSSLSQIKWNGAANGTMAIVEGPMIGARFQGISFNGNQIAGNCVVWNHLSSSIIQDVCAYNFTILGHNILAYETGALDGANQNTWINLSAYSIANNAIGIAVGKTTSSSGGLDVALNNFITPQVRCYGTGTYGWRLGYTDSCRVFGGSCSTNGNPMYIQVIAGYVNFPGAWAWYDHNFDTQAIVVSSPSTWGGTSGEPFVFYPFPLADAAVAPGPQQMLTGFTDTGVPVGWFPKPINLSSISTSGAVTNTITETTFSGPLFTVPANALNLSGAILRLRAGFVYSNVATPTLRLRAYLGGTIFFDTGVITTPTTTAITTQISIDLHTTLVGSSGTMNCYNALAMLAGNALPNQPALTANLTAALALTWTATWGTANASNQVIMESLSVEILYPAATA